MTESCVCCRQPNLNFTVRPHVAAQRQPPFTAWEKLPLSQFFNEKLTWLQLNKWFWHYFFDRNHELRETFAISAVEKKDGVTCQDWPQREKVADGDRTKSPEGWPKDQTATTTTYGTCSWSTEMGLISRWIWSTFFFTFFCQSYLGFYVPIELNESHT